MPRRPAVLTPKVPLFLIPSIIQKEVKRAGEELVRIVVKKAGRHYYNVSVRTRSICRELRMKVPQAGYSVKVEVRS
ncbi:MAG: hypothetical protein A4E34_02452 [Methanoregula sp. PtaU1.Bin006]|nr:hypothetical protein [Methanoregula sp. PtaU1.Bin006]OPX65168.1 MAG: hypothetical protein A4E33_00199 [Methanoregula sp. PtaB.Bin085]OPY32080.1 MAG: hypothetical protein A4E34_02452 [Methanoregula sp. PtaU1.Bin006]